MIVTISPTLYQTKIFICTFFPILKNFMLLPYEPNNLWRFKQNYLATVFSKSLHNGPETFQNIKSALKNHKT